MFTPPRLSRSNLKHVCTKRLASALIGLAVALPLSFTANAVPLGPTAYLSSADSPFFPFTGFSYFHLDNFESLTRTPGYSSTAGYVRLPPGGITDSVDADDGTIDGSGTGGSSFFGGGALTITFNAGDLGVLPNAAGIVWTDGAGTTSFQAFDAANNSLGTIGPVAIADGGITGTTGEDNFFGFSGSVGIARIVISNTAGGTEVDHLQYGFRDAALPPPSGVPEPSTLALLGLGLLGAAGFRRRRSPK